MKTILRRVRAEIRQSPLKKGDNVLIIREKTGKSEVAGLLLKEVIKGLPVRISKSPKSGQKYSRIILPCSLEDECIEFLEFLFGQRKIKKAQKNAVKLLRGVREDEIEDVAKSKKIKFKKAKKSPVRQMLDRLEERYPGYKFSLLNARKEYESLPE